VTLRIDTRWCPACERRDAAHVNGRCANADRHPLRSCAICGRPSSGRWCSERCYVADERPGPEGVS
jgi:hypothetical protein